MAGDGRMSALALVMVLAWKGSSGYVVGGSRAVVRGMAGRYASLGGVLRCDTPVASVSVEQGRATGVRCADGALYPAGTVISCADGHATIFNILEGGYVNKQLLQAYRHGDVFPGLIQASLGVNRNDPKTPFALSLPLSRPLQVDDLTQHGRLEFAFFGSESGLCPEGRMVIIVRCSSRFEYWDNLRKHDPESYAQAKKHLLEQIISILDAKFVGLARQIEFSDLATPATFERFTGNWQGSYQGWLPTPQMLGRRLPRALPGLANFFMAGHWVEPGGGLPSAALSARYLAQILCARDGKAFATTRV
jgi:phytoene dehydrogenase-like protein